MTVFTLYQTATVAYLRVHFAHSTESKGKYIPYQTESAGSTVLACQPEFYIMYQRRTYSLERMKGVLSWSKGCWKARLMLGVCREASKLRWKWEWRIERHPLEWSLIGRVKFGLFDTRRPTVPQMRLPALAIQKPIVRKGDTRNHCSPRNHASANPTLSECAAPPLLSLFSKVFDGFQRDSVFQNFRIADWNVSLRQREMSRCK